MKRFLVVLGIAAIVAAISAVGFSGIKGEIEIGRALAGVTAGEDTPEPTQPAPEILPTTLPEPMEYQGTLHDIADDLYPAVSVETPVTEITTAGDDTAVVCKNCSTRPSFLSTSHVTGTAKVSVSPDIAYVTIGVETKNADQNIARTENAAAMEAVLAALGGLGIADADIRTANLYIAPEYDFAAGGVITGYVGHNDIRITVRDVDAVGAVTDAVVAAGATNVCGVEFALTDSSAGYMDAVVAAIGGAKSKAAEIACAVGAADVRVLSVREVPDGRLFAAVKTMMANAGMDAAQTTVMAGDIEITASVEICYEFIW